MKISTTLRYVILATVYSTSETAGNYEQIRFDILGYSKVADFTQQFVDISVIECASKYLSYARLCSCALAGYDLKSRACHLSSNNVTLADSGSNFVVLRFSETCVTLFAPQNGHVALSDDRKTANFSCTSGYGLNGTATLHCKNGTWNGTIPVCIIDCGRTLEADYEYMTAEYPFGTLAGANATVKCAPGFRSDGGLKSWTFTCAASHSIWNISTPPDCIWELMFRGTAGNGYNVTNAFLFGDANDGMTDDESCLDVYNKNCSLNYRNSKMDEWTSLDIAKVSYELYNSSDAVLVVKFNGSGSSINSWFSSTRAISYPWHIPDIEYTWWDLNGPTDISVGRSFRATAGYWIGGKDCVDHYFTVVFYPPLWNCSYDGIFLNYPQFTYTTFPGGSIYYNESFNTAETMGIWVKYH